MGIGQIEVLVSNCSRLPLSNAETTEETTTEIARTYQPFSSQLSIYQSVLNILGAEDDVGEQVQWTAGAITVECGEVGRLHGQKKRQQRIARTCQPFSSHLSIYQPLLDIARAVWRGNSPVRGERER